MQTINKDTFDNKMHEIQTRIATLRERAKMSKKTAEEATDKQVRALEDQYKLLKAELEKKEMSAKEAYNQLSDSAKKAWTELWTGVDRAYRNLH